MNKLFHNTLYLRLQPDQLHALHVESGRTFAEAPLLALRHDKGRRVPLAAGNEALALRGQDDIELANGFEHPRTLLADFAVAEKTLQLLLRKILPPSLLQRAPTVILHPQALLEGGLTQVEIRAFAELLRGAGARQVFIWSGEELSRTDLQTQRFPAERGTLLYPESVA